MDNILYIGPYREFSGMGNASRNYIKALYQTGHNISIRPCYNIFKAYPETDIDASILELENNFSKKYHTVIQHGYPHQFSYNSKFDKIIGITHLESSNYFYTLNNYLNCLDIVIVGSEVVKNAIQNNNLISKIEVVPEPIDTDLIKNYVSKNSKIKKNFYSFYTVGDFISRKNIKTILLAFLILVDDHTDIELVIKTKNPADNSISNLIEYEFEKIYDTIRKEINKKPKILVGDVGYESILYLHNNNDCFINCSSGESFGYSTLEALAFNNNIIVTNNIGSTDIVSGGCGQVVDSELVECIDKDRVYNLYNSIDQGWREPSLSKLINKMIISMYESEKDKNIRIQNQQNKIINYSIESIKNKLLDVL